LSFYGAGEQVGVLPQDKFEFMSDSPIFAPVDEFIQWEPVTTDTESAKQRYQCKSCEKRFDDLITKLKKDGFPVLERHIACSAAALRNALYHCDAIRLGISLYGLWPSEEIRRRVDKVRSIQKERYMNDGITFNAHLESKELERYCIMDKESEELLKLAILELGISARAYDKILKVSRTIADLDGKDIIEAYHISEAISYRSLDRNLWG